MAKSLFQILGRSGPVRGRITALFAVIIAANLGAWAWALAAFRDHPVLLGTALLAYSFGLRHAVDADHIAAIDNVTRRMMQDGRRPVTLGFFFSLGHSTVVVLASVAIAATALAFKSQMNAWHLLGGIIGTLVSSGFLFAIAAMNLAVLAGLYRSFRSVKAGAPYRADAVDHLLHGGGLLARLFRPLFAMISRPWQMYPLGLLFGLGFDTATEVGLLGISAAQAAHGMPIWSILVFPALFTAGMALIDTADSILMLGAYGWAFIKPVRKLYYNMVVTLVSVLVAVIVGGIEALGLAADQFNLTGPVWNLIGALNDHFGTIGYVIIGVFALSWLVSALHYRVQGYDRLDAEPG
jgi:high-affinity nickel-transport protein